MKPADVEGNTYIDFEKEVNDKDLKFKVGLKKLLLLVKLKMLFHGHMLLIILMVKKLLEHFMEKSNKRLIKRNSEQKK